MRGNTFFAAVHHGGNTLKRITSALLFICLGCVLHAQTTHNADFLKKSVVFLYSLKPNSAASCTDLPKRNDSQPALTQEQISNCVATEGTATGFLVMVPKKGFPLAGYLLLITARHVVDPEWAYCTVSDPEVMFIRLNKKEYDPNKDESGVNYYPVHLRDANEHPLYAIRDDDDEIDAAVVDLASLNLDQTKNDFVPMSLSTFATADELNKLRIGDGIDSAGLLPGKSGEKRNYPFFKFGELANISDGPVKVGCGWVPMRVEHVWFVSVNIAPGNSGSPILYDSSALCAASALLQCSRPNRGMLVGIQSSRFADPGGGEDIAGITPIADVFTIIKNHSSSDADLHLGDDASRPQ
jgi:hypothetical protein